MVHYSWKHVSIRKLSVTFGELTSFQAKQNSHPEKTPHWNLLQKKLILPRTRLSDRERKKDTSSFKVYLLIVVAKEGFLLFVVGVSACKNMCLNVWESFMFI